MGRLIAIEGIDGSGKGTQTARLAETLRGEGKSVAVLGFPRYDVTFFGARIGEFLNGEFGQLNEVHPWLAAMLYAGDRWESLDVLRNALQENEYVILDRYVASNAAHQGAKLDGDARLRLWEQIDHLEHTLYRLPRPDRVILLDVPVEMSQKLIEKKGRRSYTDQKADLQEADTSYQERVRQCYLDLAAMESHWRSVPVVDSDGLRSLDDIAGEIRRAVD